MPKYQIEVARRVKRYESAVVTVEAPSMKEARTKGLKLAQREPDELRWDDSDSETEYDSYEVIEATEVGK